MGSFFREFPINAKNILLGWQHWDGVAAEQDMQKKREMAEKVKTVIWVRKLACKTFFFLWKEKNYDFFSTIQN